MISQWQRNPLIHVGNYVIPCRGKTKLIIINEIIFLLFKTFKSISEYITKKIELTVGFLFGFFFSFYTTNLLYSAPKDITYAQVINLCKKLFEPR